MREGFLIYVEMRKYLIIYAEAVSHIWLCNRFHLNFLILEYEEYFVLFFISVYPGTDLRILVTIELEISFKKLLLFMFAN